MNWKPRRYVWLMSEDWPAVTAHPKKQVSQAGLLYWRMLLRWSLSYLFSDESFFHLESTEYSGVSKTTSWFSAHMLSACVLDMKCCSADRVKLLSPLNQSCPEPANTKLSAPVTGRAVWQNSVFFFGVASKPVVWKQAGGKSCNTLCRAVDSGCRKGWASGGLCVGTTKMQPSCLSACRC